MHDINGGRHRVTDSTLAPIRGLGPFIFLRSIDNEPKASIMELNLQPNDLNSNILSANLRLHRLQHRIARRGITLVGASSAPVSIQHLAA